MRLTSQFSPASQEAKDRRSSHLASISQVAEAAASAAASRCAVALEVPGVQALDKCRVRKSGLSHLVDIQVRVDGELTVREGHDIAHALRAADDGVVAVHQQHSRALHLGLGFQIYRQHPKNMSFVGGNKHRIPFSLEFLHRE